MAFRIITEEPSLYRHLENMSVDELVSNINKEDKKVAVEVERALPQISALTKVVSDKLKKGGRLFYIGAGTSGRLGILDASECPPTYGVSPDLISGIIAGGEKAITTSIESAEDDVEQGWKDLSERNITANDVVIGLAASGTTPYVLQTLSRCRENNIVTGSICCNPDSPLSKVADFPIEVIVGPEFVTGSTRMKSGTAQKMVLNMISTAAMIQLGRVEDNLMVNMQLTNKKIKERGVRILMGKLKLTNHEEAKDLLAKYGGVKKAINNYVKR
ncbi:MAG: N-acetylmuramic acid 6-phosphate etherase [Ginsengibacter sp.]